MSTYSLSETDGIGAQAPAAQSRDWLRGAGIGILAVLGWVAFGLSCLIWEDLGDWSRTHELGVGAFVVAAVVLVGTSRSRSSRPRRRRLAAARAMARGARAFS